jgi:acyl-CoA synthetase (NDP forming)
MEIIYQAKKDGRLKLSEYESKRILAAYGIPVTREILVTKRDDLLKAAHEIGYPLVMKGCSSEVAHKTEKGLVYTDIRSDQEVLGIYNEIMFNLKEKDAGVLVQEMVNGKRELVVGLVRDSQFGPCVMFGLGGIFTEILQDISFRIAPLEKKDALEMMGEIKGHRILKAVRGMEAADVDQLCRILVRVGQIGLENESIKEIDINPLILSGSHPVAVDALVVLASQ